VNLTTFTNRCSSLSDIEIVIKPNTDLAIQNYILREIVYNRPQAIDWDFVNQNCVFATGVVISDTVCGRRSTIRSTRKRSLTRQARKHSRS
jgi:nitrate reductase NapA